MLVFIQPAIIMSPVIKSALAVIVCLYCIACKQKKKEEEIKPDFFPVLAFIKSQVAHVDTSFYSIKKITVIDSLHSDTTYLPRESFRAAANDFLSLPDISAPGYGTRYKEDKQFDETLGRVVLTYTPVNPDKEEIQNQQLFIRPDPEEGDKITKIIFETGNSKDSLIEKKMIWNVDKNFQVTTIKQDKNGSETISTFSVVWNEDDNN